MSVSATSTTALGFTLVDTGGSVGTETNALALMEACRQIRDKMRKICEARGLNPETAQFADVAGLQQGCCLLALALAPLLTAFAQRRALRCHASRT